MNLRMSRLIGCLLPLLLMGCASVQREFPPPSDRLERALAASADFPVATGAAVDPAFCRPGQACDVVVIVRTARGWHISPMDLSTGPEIATSLSGAAPTGTSWGGPWKVQRQDQGPVYEGTVRFVRALKIDREARGEITVPLKLTYQACDAFSCRPPISVPLSALVKVAAK